jgi:hypothetical protein
MFSRTFAVALIISSVFMSTLAAADDMQQDADAPVLLLTGLSVPNCKPIQPMGLVISGMVSRSPEAGLINRARDMGANVVYDIKISYGGYLIGTAGHLECLVKTPKISKLSKQDMKFPDNVWVDDIYIM